MKCSTKIKSRSVWLSFSNSLNSAHSFYHSAAMMWKLMLNKTLKLLWLMMTHSFLWWHKKTALSLQRESRLHTNPPSAASLIEEVDSLCSSWCRRQPAAGSLQPSDCVTYYIFKQKTKPDLHRNVQELYHQPWRPAALMPLLRRTDLLWTSSVFLSCWRGR